jgi:hypothetical protein
MSDTDGTVMGRPLLIPLVDKIPGADREPVTAVGITDLQNGAGDGFGLGHE